MSVTSKLRLLPAIAVFGVAGLAIASPAYGASAECGASSRVGCSAEETPKGDDGERDDLASDRVEESDKVDPWTEYCIKKYATPDEVVTCILGWVD